LARKSAPKNLAREAWKGGKGRLSWTIKRRYHILSAKKRKSYPRRSGKDCHFLKKGRKGNLIESWVRCKRLIKVQETWARAIGEERKHQLRGGKE